MSLFIKYIEENNLSKFSDITNKLLDIKGLVIKENGNENENENGKGKGNLYLVKYNKKEGTEEDYNTYSFLKESRSLIIEKETNKIVCMSLTFKDSYEEFIDNVEWEDNVIEESIDGTLINLYYYNNVWNISTRGTLDANCYWNSSKTFHTLFTESSQSLNYDLLKTNFCYSFVLCHPESRNISKYNDPKIIHILSRNMDTLLESDEEIGIIKPAIIKILNVNKLEADSYQKLEHSVDSLDYVQEGYMIYSKNRLYRTKLRSAEFNKVSKIKGNEPFIIKRLLVLRKMGELGKLTEFLYYFNEYMEQYNNMEQSLTNIINEIYNYYIQIKIKKNFIDLPHFSRKAIYEIHNIYLGLASNYVSGAKPTIRKDDVKDWFESQDVNYQYYLYNVYVNYIANGE
uniref:Uncharacterized protein n=1 Tax=viral metagenome TaxID=1070528 RepID=A0A6C0EMJ3_9ZZZZ